MLVPQSALFSALIALSSVLDGIDSSLLGGVDGRILCGVDVGLPLTQAYLSYVIAVLSSKSKGQLSDRLQLTREGLRCMLDSWGLSH